MKNSLKLITLFAVVLITLSNCSRNDTEEPESEIHGGRSMFYSYNLLLSFQDTSGNDLVKGIGFDWWQPEDVIITEEEASGGTVKRNLYTLEGYIVYPEEIVVPFHATTDFGWPIMMPLGEIHYGKAGTVFGRQVSNIDYDLLAFQAVSSIFNYNIIGFDGFVVEHPFDEPLKIIFRLRCPYLFGDNATHDIVIWWERYY